MSRRSVGGTDGASGYQNHGCRCEICRAAWNTKAKAKYAAKRVSRWVDNAILSKPSAAPGRSWWLDATPEQFSEIAAQELPRITAHPQFGGSAVVTRRFEGI